MRRPLFVVVVALVLPGAASAGRPATELASAAAPQPAAGTAVSAATLNAGAADPGDGTQAAPRKRLWTWVAAGGATALALGGLVVGLNAQSTYDELEARCAPSCAKPDAETVDRRAIAADALLGSAAVIAAVAVVLYFVEGRAPAGTTVNPVAGPGGFGVNAALEY